MQTMRIESPAKINLVLDLLYKRSDGYHEVEFLMQELALHDVIECSVRKDSEISLTCDDPTIYTDERNLIVKAAKLLQSHCGSKKGAAIYLEKHIPMVGGLGGSSSNAVSTLKALNVIWEIGLTDAQLLELAIKIGMDCAFFILGGTCLARNRGEVIEKTLSPAHLDILIVTPEVSVPENKTAWIYGNFSVERVKKHPSLSAAVEAIATADVLKIAHACGNVFEQGLAINDYEPVWELLEELRANPLVLTAHLAGAGPAIFAIARDALANEKLCDDYSKRFKQVLLTITR